MWNWGLGTSRERCCRDKKKTKMRATCIRNIYLKCYIFRQILGKNLSFFLYNQPKKII